MTDTRKNHDIATLRLADQYRAQQTEVQKVVQMHASQAQDSPQGVRDVVNKVLLLLGFPQRQRLFCQCAFVIGQRLRKVQQAGSFGHLLYHCLCYLHISQVIRQMAIKPIRLAPNRACSQAKS